ncbi:MAG: methionyl-tRNA formyltransferase [Hydrotalea sp.]|nr:methionyl-tRNA formyltransferase [Hydrotalea sp.]
MLKRFQDWRIVFMGTPDFAVASLKALVEAGANIVGVVTAPDKPAGRGMQLQQSDVKKFALEQNLSILQPVTLKSPEFIEQLKELKADIQVVVAFRMLPEIVWNMPPLGTINVHGSLLPKFRGAAPIHWAVIRGEKITGVTTFQLKHVIDTGDILLQKSIPIPPNATTGDLYAELKMVGADLLIETLDQLAKGNLQPTPQESVGDVAYHAPKIFTETCIIHWNDTSENIHNLIRGLAPHPSAFTTFQDKKLKIHKAGYRKEAHNKPTGSVQSDGKAMLEFATNDGWIIVEELQLEGKKKMDTATFLRGYAHLIENK